MADRYRELRPDELPAALAWVDGAAPSPGLRRLSVAALDDHDTLRGVALLRAENDDQLVLHLHADDAAGGRRLLSAAVGKAHAAGHRVRRVRPTATTPGPAVWAAAAWGAPASEPEPACDASVSLARPVAAGPMAADAVAAAPAPAPADPGTTPEPPAGDAA